MSENRVETPEPAETHDVVEDYASPALTDLGSFAELTQNGLSGNVDAEGMS
ncbi:MAG TPA: lasso RiPP family leader peptide-containing protein [Solirubrobacteraceae bacterium]|nr:lasso RiPP family leader peptide-containing protein [Solirubrobacteraceae bacterium]